MVARLLLEVGMGPARAVIRYVGHGPVTIKKFYLQFAPTRARGPNPPFLCFLPKTVKNTKTQHKTWAGPREARALPAGLDRAVDKFLKFQARPAIYSSPQTELVNRPDPCPPLVTSHALIEGPRSDFARESE